MDTNFNIDISVIIPVYNVELYLEECLNSVLNQSFKSYEIICVNDASTDRSLKILEQYSELYEIVIINHSINQGLSAARNTGMQYAKGKYIFFLDSDDMIVPETLEELYMCAEKNSLDEVYFNMQYIYEKGLEYQMMKSPKQYKEYGGVLSGQEMFCKFSEDKAYKIEAWRQFYRREFLERNNLKFYEGILHEDNLFSFMCAMKSERVMNINKEFYIYRKRNNSIMTTIDNKRAESLFIVLVEIFKYWNTHSFTDDVSKAISDYFAAIYNTFQIYRNYCNGFNIQIGSNAEKYLYKLINSSRTYIHDSMSREKINELNKAEFLIVYGAGKAAIQVIHTLKEHGLSIGAVAVTSKNANAETICGIKVQEIGELLEYKRNATVVIAVARKNEHEVFEKLNEMGFLNIMTR